MTGRLIEKFNPVDPRFRRCRPALAGGESGVITADLKPGSYEIVCFRPGHYAAGQKPPFKVT